MNSSEIKIKVVSLIKFIVGGKNINQLLNLKYCNVYKKSKIIFVHIPKAAGTSITQAIYGRRNGHLTASFIRQKLGPLFEEKYSFSVCRNPYERLVSAYNFAKQGKTLDGAIAHPEFYQNDAFKTFDSFVNEWLVKQDIKILDPVFQPQFHFVYEDNTCLVNEIFKIEDSQMIENKLSAVLDKNIQLKKKNVSQHSETKYYTPELRSIVYEIYKNDFLLFDYKK